jgi:hypothetical protein
MRGPPLYMMYRRAYVRESASLGHEARAEVRVVGVDEGDGIALLIHHLACI